MILFLFKYLNFSLDIIDAGTETRNLLFLSVTFLQEYLFILSNNMLLDVYSKKIKIKLYKTCYLYKLISSIDSRTNSKILSVLKQLNNIVINKIKLIIKMLLNICLLVGWKSICF